MATPRRAYAQRHDRLPSGAGARSEERSSRSRSARFTTATAGWARFAVTLASATSSSHCGWGKSEVAPFPARAATCHLWSSPRRHTTRSASAGNPHAEKIAPAYVARSPNGSCQLATYTKDTPRSLSCQMRSSSRSRSARSRV